MKIRIAEKIHVLRRGVTGRVGDTIVFCSGKIKFNDAAILFSDIYHFRKDRLCQKCLEIIEKEGAINDCG